MVDLGSNPFSVFSPEGLPANDVVELFVSDVPGVEAIQAEGHTLLIGSRGSGKSMILRYLEPDCQLVERTSQSHSPILSDLPFYAAYLSVKQTDLYYPELERVAGSNIDHTINEHILIITILLKITTRAREIGIFKDGAAPLSQHQRDECTKLVRRMDASNASNLSEGASARDVLAFVHRAVESQFDYTLSYFDSFINLEPLPGFTGRLCRFSNVLLPFLTLFRELPGMPASGRLFLIIDDADNLNATQTRILNTWIAQRLRSVSLKVAAQTYEYKTFFTLNDKTIEAPHDFSEINISDIYTSNRGSRYRDRVWNIVNRRLQRAGVPSAVPGKVVNASDFFPEDNAQRLSIERIEVRYRKEWAASGRGHRGRDDAYRYSRPDFINDLGGRRKSRHTYSYSGFDQLVNISSGVPRYFLESAHKMFDRERARHPGRILSSLSPSIQDEVVRQQGEHLYMSEIEKLRLSEIRETGGPQTAIRLHHLIGCLCSLFQLILRTQDLSERRVFSFAVSDNADDEVEKVLRLGVKFSLFQKTTIGRKEGFGKTDRYILTRRLAPMFNLDPNGFSGYKFLMNRTLRMMMNQPDAYRRQLRHTTDASKPDPQEEFQFDEET